MLAWQVVYVNDTKNRPLFRDKKVSDDKGVPGYVGTPAGNIKKYAPDPKKKRKGSVTTIGTGCK